MRWVFGSLKDWRYSSLERGRLHMILYHGLRLSAVALSWTISSQRAPDRPSRPAYRPEPQTSGRDRPWRPAPLRRRSEDIAFSSFEVPRNDKCRRDFRGLSPRLCCAGPSPDPPLPGAPFGSAGGLPPSLWLDGAYRRHLWKSREVVTQASPSRDSPQWRWRPIISICGHST